MHDKLAVSKIVQQLSRGSLRSALATSLLIRYTSNLLHEDLNATSARDAYQFLENCFNLHLEGYFGSKCQFLFIHVFLNANM